MNPYETPEAKLTPPAKLSTDQLDWVSVLIAGAIYLVTQVMGVLVIMWLEPQIPLVVLFTCFFAPWVLGAFYLGRKVRKSRVAHGLVYSTIPPLALAFWYVVFSQGNAIDLAMIILTSGAAIISIVLTLVTMAATRLFQ